MDGWKTVPVFVPEQKYQETQSLIDNDPIITKFLWQYKKS